MPCLENWGGVLKSFLLANSLTYMYKHMSRDHCSLDVLYIHMYMYMYM